MNTRKSFFIFFIMALVHAVLLSEEVQRFEEALDQYIKNDTTFKEVALEYESAFLAYQKTEVHNSVSASLSSGISSVTSQLVLDKNRAYLSVAPSVTVDIPEFQNTKVEAKAPLTIPLDNDTPVSVNNAGVSVSVDLLSGNKKNRELSLKKAQESLNEAKAKKKMKVLSLKKEFLQTLKSIYLLQTQLLTQEENALKKEMELALNKAQGFEESSAKFRLAYLNWQSAVRDYEKTKRSFEKEVSEFSAKCNMTNPDLSFTIPEETLYDMQDFPKNEFSHIKKSLLNYENNSIAQEAKIPFTLSLNAGYGYSFNDPNTIETLSSGLSFKNKGFSASLGIQKNLEEISKPQFTFSLGYSFLENKLAHITTSEDKIQEEKLLYAIEAAETAYQSMLNEKQKERDDLIWQLDKNKEHEVLYSDLARDMETWYENGLVSKTEYQQAFANYIKAKAELQISKIECSIYNVDIALLFY